MRYENQQPAEGINVTKVNPGVQFLKLLIASIILVVLVVIVLQFVGGSLAKRVPFKYEKQLTENMDMSFLGTDNTSDEEISIAATQMRNYLNDLAEQMAPSLDLPEDMSIYVHYNDDDVFNAFATIGGNLIFYKALLAKMPHENALAMVMAHEIAHIKHRDPIVGLGGGVASMVAVSMVTGASGVAERFLTHTTLVTGMQFTRDMETRADQAALNAVNQLYGHVNGAGSLFEVMGTIKSDSDALPDWLERFARTHPLSQDRVNAVRSMAIKNNWRETGELTPLPESFQSWLSAAP